jgi:ferredoxin
VAGCTGLARVTFDPPGETVDAACGATVLQAAVDAGVPIQDQCGGRGICGTCAVRVVEGELTPPGVLETLRLGPRTSAVRLACQARVSGDATVKPLLPLAK